MQFSGFSEMLSCGGTDSNWYNNGDQLTYDCSVRYRQPDALSRPTISLEWMTEDGSTLTSESTTSDSNDVMTVR